jgi:hypothetical protein
MSCAMVMRGGTIRADSDVPSKPTTDMPRYVDAEVNRFAEHGDCLPIDMVGQDLGVNPSNPELMQIRSPVGGGPPGKT